MALTTLTRVKQYLYQAGDTASTDDTLLELTIGQLSNAILDYIQRPQLFKKEYIELRDGVGNNTLMLRNYPVISVSSLTTYGCLVNGFATGTQTIPSATFGQTGYTIDVWDGTQADNPHRITLLGYYFPRGSNNIRIVYTAGYSVTDAAFTISSAVTSSGSSGLAKYTALQPYGTWGQDDGVVYTSSGSSLTALPSSTSSSPSTGQYVVTNGVYQFSAADSGLQVSVSYSYVPSAVEQACIQWVAERYKYRQRIGQKSQSTGGQVTASYDTSAMPSYVELMLNPYRKWLPI